jgi:hypothetical protein
MRLLLLASLVFTDLPPAAQHLLEKMGVGEAAFPEYIRLLESSAADRERIGENDHLVFYVLQSRQFTKAPPIEPALSAKEFVRSAQIPAGVSQRFRDFLAAPVRGERMIYLRRIAPSVAYIGAEYERVMRSLYQKEFEDRPDYYRSRGHSTDTQITANYTVWTALSVLHEMQPNLKIARVLVVGPGLDFAPRTGFDDRYPPQSYQPYAVADALISIGFSETPRVECVDINERVIHFLREFSKAPVLRILSPPGDASYREYFRRLGASIGEVEVDGPWEKTIRVRKQIAASVAAGKFNVITELGSGGYDLVVATNVLLYFNNAELLLALANLQSMLAPGGYLVHNEFRPEIDGYAQAAGLAPVQARTIRVAAGVKSPLYDGFAIYRK